jgi:hypothetical protein
MATIVAQRKNCEDYNQKNHYLCTMNILNELARMVLPSEKLEDFEIVKIEQSETLIEISLDEKYHAEYRDNTNIESKGFTRVKTITDFPIRDHKVLLHVRRRWYNISEGKSFNRIITLSEEGTSYSKEFATFLKETYGEFPSDLPHA